MYRYSAASADGSKGKPRKAAKNVAGGSFIKPASAKKAKGAKGGEGGEGGGGKWDKVGRYRLKSVDPAL